MVQALATSTPVNARFMPQRFLNGCILKAA
jgi:hypothetical protein